MSKKKENGIPEGGWHIESEFTNYRDRPENHAGSIKLNGSWGDYHIFKIEPNGIYALGASYKDNNEEETKQLSQEFAELVVKVLNRELPGGKLRVRRKGVK